MHSIKQMELKTVAAINYNKNLGAACVYKDSRFTLISVFTDTRECGMMKTILYKYSVDLCILTTSIDLFRFTHIKETGSEFKLVDGSWFSQFREHSGLGCLSAMCRYYGKDFVRLEGNGRIGYIGSIPVELVNLSNHSYLDSEAIHALKLLNQVSHPSRFVKTEIEKNSLFETINFTVTKMGKDLLKQWMLWPMNSAKSIMSRLEDVTECRNICKLLLPYLKKCKTYDKNDFTKLKSFLTGVIDIKNTLAGSRLKYSGSTKEIVAVLEKISVYDGMEIRKGAFNELDSLRCTFDRLPDYLNKIAEIIAEEEKKELSVVYFPQVGYLLEVETKECDILSDTHLSGLGAKKCDILFDTHSSGLGAKENHENSLDYGASVRVKKRCVDRLYHGASIRANEKHNEAWSQCHRESIVTRGLESRVDGCHHLSTEDDHAWLKNEAYSKFPDEVAREMNKKSGLPSDILTEKTRYSIPRTRNDTSLIEAESLQLLGVGLEYKPIAPYGSEYSTSQTTKLPDIDFHKNKSLLRIKEFKFSLGTKKYYKNEIMRILDKDLGDLHLKIRDFETDVRMDILKSIESVDLPCLEDYIAYVDAIYSLSIYSIKYCCIKPTFVESKILKMVKFMNHEIEIDINNSSIVRGQHPFVISLGQAVVLAHMGSYVPCDMFKLKIFDKIFVKIEQYESFSQKKSAFMSDILKIKQMINESTTNSLCLIKDLGVGTNYAEGLGLFYAIHSHMCNPFVVSITNLELSSICPIESEVVDMCSCTNKGRGSRSSIQTDLCSCTKHSIPMDICPTQQNSIKESKLKTDRTDRRPQDIGIDSKIEDICIENSHQVTSMSSSQQTDKIDITPTANISPKRVYLGSSSINRKYNKELEPNKKSFERTINSNNFGIAYQSLEANHIKGLLPNYDVLQSYNVHGKIVVNDKIARENSLMEMLCSLGYDEKFLMTMDKIIRQEYDFGERDDSWAVKTINELIHEKR